MTVTAPSSLGRAPFIFTPAWNELLPDHLSASSLTMFARCPEQWRNRYVLGIKSRPGAALIWGGADHFAHETNFAQKIESFTDLPLNAVQDAFRDGVRQRIEDSGGFGEIEWGRIDGAAEIIDRGVGLVAAYHNAVSPLVQPVAVEQRFSLEYPWCPVPIIGYIDLETEPRIIEGKTSGQKVSRPKPEWRLQAKLYQAARRKPVSWHLRVKTRVPAVYTARDLPGLASEYSETQVDLALVRVRRLVSRISEFYKRYGPDRPWPTDAPNIGWKDDFCGFCGYRPDCAWWAE